MSLPVLPERDNAKYHCQPMTGESNEEIMTAQRGGQGEDKRVFSYVSPPLSFFAYLKALQGRFLQEHCRIY